MTHATVRTMTDEQLRVRVAELLGWRRSTWREQGYSRGADGEVWLEKDSNICRPLHADDDPFKYPFPDYPHDLNACHEMEKALLRTDDKGRVLGTKWYTYAHTLSSLVPFGQPIICATARQRCEAFVIAMEGK